jgi:hypothetical protein
MSTLCMQGVLPTHRRPGSWRVTRLTPLAVSGWNFMALEFHAG